MELLDLGKLSQYRFQKIPVLVANASPAGSYENNVTLDKQFNKILGIGFFEVAGGGITPNYNVGAKTDRQTWIDPINYNAWVAGAGVGPMQKYYSVNIPYASGDNFYAMIQTGALLTADLVGQMVLLLSKDLDQIAR